MNQELIVILVLWHLIFSLFNYHFSSLWIPTRPSYILFRPGKNEQKIDYIEKTRPWLLFSLLLKSTPSNSRKISTRENWTKNPLHRKDQTLTIPSSTMLMLLPFHEKFRPGKIEQKSHYIEKTRLWLLLALLLTFVFLPIHGKFRPGKIEQKIHYMVLKQNWSFSTLISKKKI